MGDPVRIVDLAQQLIDMLRPSTRIEFTGLRPGEKLHEVLISEHEIGESRVHPRINHTTTVDLDPIEALSTISSDFVADTERMLASATMPAPVRLTS